MERWQTRATLITLIVAAAGVLVAVARGRVHTVLVWLLAAVIIVCLIGLVVSFRPRPTPVKSEPRLIFDSPSVELQPLGLSAASVPVTGYGGEQHEEWLRRRPDLDPEAWFVYARVRNVPIVGADGRHDDARNVHATLRFIGVSGDEIAKVDGRWTRRLQDELVEPAQDPPTIDLLADAGPYKLDVAIKYRSDPQCYAWNDRSRFRTTALQEFPLGKDPVTVQIHLEGAGVTATATYLLAHSGVSPKPPTLTQIH